VGGGRLGSERRRERERKPSCARQGVQTPFTRLGRARSALCSVAPDVNRCAPLPAPARSAAEKAGRTDLALQLFERMHQEGCRPNVVTYNSLIAACSHGAAAGGLT
jgi:pentatricopeptide repeat protein